MFTFYTRIRGPYSTDSSLRGELTANHQKILVTASRIAQSHMEPTPLEGAIRTLTEKRPSYAELMELYGTLLETPPNDCAETVVARRALAQIVGEIVDYLAVVGTKLEKALGVTRRDERLRILEGLERPDSGTAIERVYAITTSWERIERYRFDRSPGELFVFE